LPGRIFVQTTDILSARRGGAANLVVLYAATMLLSATLLFAVQPMFTKMVLPILGGSPAVWNTAMMFFQMVLLGGYAYAHLTSRLLTWRRQAILHVTLLVAAFAALPIMPIAGWTPPTDGLQVFWLLGLFAASIGLPFFVVSANAPLLQRWFAVSGHASAADPYFLYGASNLGSIVALLAYPVAVQPVLGLYGQGIAWTAGYAVLVVLIGLCALSIRRHAESQPVAAQPHTQDAAAPSSWRLRLQWIVFALVPSSLMLGVTTHISTDVAAVPLLWILPLTLYLLTFVIVFSRRPVLKHEWMVAALPYLAILVVPNLMGIGKDWLYALGLHLTVFFICAMVCHGELVKRRPAASNLTEFYLFMSIGGMLGGIFNALLAPVLFTSVIEYPLALIAACLLRPEKAPNRRQWRKDLLLPALLLTALVLPAMLPGFRVPEIGKIGSYTFLLGLCLIVFSFKDHSLRFALGLAATMLVINALTQHAEVLARERSFFGVHRVQAYAGGAVNLLLHGTTIHGAQYTDPAKRRTQLIYYHRAGPFGQLFEAYAGHPQTEHVAVVGLGAGALACYRQPGEDWTFYEIDPVVVSVARDSGLFHYLEDCAKDSPIVMGDARLSLRNAPAHRYGIMFLDAFSSDAIPIHLMTREALQSYLGKLAADGIIAFHISNRYLDLAPVIAALAEDAGLAGRTQRYVPTADLARMHASVPAELVILSREDRYLKPLDKSGKWRRLDTIRPTKPWTDDYSNIVGAIK
jgi:hypothetical protein